MLKYIFITIILGFIAFIILFIICSILINRKDKKMNNDLINELNNKIDAQDKIINTQALEIARLEKAKEILLKDRKKATDLFVEYKKRINKAIELAKIRIESCNAGLSNAETSIVSKHSLLRLEIQSYKELLEILGDKENE